MIDHSFGGEWTQEKLARVGKYLPAYTTIFHANPYAKRHYRTMYVDAFAGTGYRTERLRHSQETTQRLLEVAVVEREAFAKGSAVLALEVEPPFDHYLFIEKNRRHALALENLKSSHPQRADKMNIVSGDANERLTEMCMQTDWSQWRAVVFLDPYGMQVNWKTIETIAGTRAIDLWLLFPLAQAINRLLTKQPPPQKWANALTRVFGTEEWRSEFYAPPRSGGLFEDDEIVGVETKNTDFDHIAAFFTTRLNSVFTEESPKPLPLEGPNKIPLYLLCFAFHNKAAIKIARHILGN